jgi:hypothetical protein
MRNKTARNLLASRKRGRRSAERRIQPCPHRTSWTCRLKVHRRQVYAVCVNPSAVRKRSQREPLAFRRSTAALVQRPNALTQVQAALHANERERALPAPSIALKPGIWRAGRNAGGHSSLHWRKLRTLVCAARTARERRVSRRPREPHSLPSVEYPRPKGPSLIRARWGVRNRLGDGCQNVPNYGLDPRPNRGEGPSSCFVRVSIG